MAEKKQALPSLLVKKPNVLKGVENGASRPSTSSLFGSPLSRNWVLQHHTPVRAATADVRRRLPRAIVPCTDKTGDGKLKAPQGSEAEGLEESERLHAGPYLGTSIPSAAVGAITYLLRKAPVLIRRKLSVPCTPPSWILIVEASQARLEAFPSRAPASSAEIRP
jgi:hypothetical protein